MQSTSRVDSGDAALIQTVDAALAEAAPKSGPWLACRPGCTQCCIGPFPITPLDARRLRQGLASLEASDPERAAHVRERARDAVSRFACHFPGDSVTGVLFEGHPGEQSFYDETDEEHCPALDPQTGLCDLYTARPLACRAFGPPIRFAAESLAVCELCFEGASDDEIAACEVEIDPGDLESGLLREVEETTGARGDTLVAFALAEPWLTTTKSGC